MERDWEKKMNGNKRNGASNSIRHHPSQQQQSSDAIPEIGFLVIRQTRPEDEGDYWCERIHDGQQGERTRLRVAFLEPFAAGAQPRLATPAAAPERGQLLVLECERPAGVPQPLLSWHFVRSLCIPCVLNATIFTIL